jgi:hypothetical protein
MFYSYVPLNVSYDFTVKFFNSHDSYQHKTACGKDNDAILKPEYKIILPLTYSDSDSECSLWLQPSGMKAQYFS